MATSTKSNARTMLQIKGPSDPRGLGLHAGFHEYDGNKKAALAAPLFKSNLADPT